MSLFLAVIASVALSYQTALVSYSPTAPLASVVAYVAVRATLPVAAFMLLHGYLAEWRRVKRNQSVRLLLKFIVGPTLFTYILFPNELLSQSISDWRILAILALFMYAAVDVDGSISRAGSYIFGKGEQGGHISLFRSYPPQSSADLHRFDLLMLALLSVMLLRKLT